MISIRNFTPTLKKRGSKHSAASRHSIRPSRRPRFESLEERTLLAVVIDGITYDSSASGMGWTYDASTTTLLLDGYASGRIEATAQSLILLLAESSTNSITVTEGGDALSVDGDLTIGKQSTDTTSGSLTITVDLFTHSSAINGIDVTGNVTIEDVETLTVTMTDANAALVVGGDLAVTDNGTVTLTVGQTNGQNDDGCTVAGNFTLTGTGSYLNSGGLYVAGTVTFASGSTATMSVLGKTVDYYVSTWTELLAAFNTSSGVNASARQGTESTILLVGAAGTGGAVTHEITVASTLTLNNAGSSAATTVNILSSGDATLIRSSSLTAGVLISVGTTATVNQLNALSLGVDGGMGSSTLTIDGGAVWTSATDGAPASYTLTTSDGVSTLVTTAGTIDTASGGFSSTYSLLYDAGTLTVYGGVILQNNANTTSNNGSAVSRNQAGAIFVRGTGTGSLTDPDASGNAILTLQGGLIQNCSGQYGGAVEIYGTFRFNSGTIDGCAATASSTNTIANEGGGIFNTCNFIMSGGLIENCVAYGDYYNGSTLPSTGNAYGKGGALHNGTNAVAIISGGQIASNVSGWAGGGIYAGGLGTSTLQITGGIIDHNLASIGGGIYMNAQIEITGGEIIHNTIANNHNPHSASTAPTNRYGYGYGIFIEYYNNSSSLYPVLTVGGSVVINTNNSVYLATIQNGTSYFQPIVIESELTSSGPTMYIVLGFTPTAAEIADHETLFARYADNTIPVNEAKFLLGYGADLSTLYTASLYTADNVNYLEIALASSVFQARVGEYYFETLADGLAYVNANYATGTDVTLYLLANAVLTETLSVEADVDLTIAAETTTTQAAALELYQHFIDYATSEAVDAQTAYGEYTMLAAQNITISSGANGVLTVASGAELTIGDGTGTLFFDGNYAFPVAVAGIYVEGGDGSVAAGALTVASGVSIRNYTNDASSGYETGGVVTAGAMTLDGGTILDNVGAEAGGIRVLDGGTLTLQGGIISANLGGPAGTWGEPTSYTGAGGILIDSGAAVTIPADASSLFISANHGLYGAIENNGTFSMSAGTIQNNLASSTTSETLGGVYQNGTMTIGSSALILANSTATNGVYLTEGNIITVGSEMKGGNSAALPLTIDSSTVVTGTVLVETSYDGPVNHELNGESQDPGNEIDSAYDVLLSGVFVHAQGAWIVQGTESTGTGRVTAYPLTNELVIGSAVITYNANAPTGTTSTGSTTDPQGTTGYNGNTLVALQSNGFTITGTSDNYQFIAWNTLADGSGVWYYPYGSSGDSLTTVADVTLYAVWSSANVFVVNTLTDSTTSDDYTSLREAIILANGSTVESGIPVYINFETTLTAWEQSWDSVTTGVVDLVSSLPALSNSIVISTTAFYTATGKSLSIDGGGDYRVFTVTGGTADLPVWIAGLTLQNGGGLDPTNSAGSAHGGAVYLAAGAVAKLEEIVFTDNSANLTTLAKASGGALFNRGTVTLTNCTVTQSAGTSAGYQNAYYGGGIYNVGTLTMSGRTIEYCGSTASGGALYNAGTATVSSCDITSNKSTNNGGGICNVSTSAALGVLSLANSRLTDNTATGFGGGLCNTGTATLSSVTLTGNTSDKNGGGVCNSYYVITNVGASTMSMTECTLSENEAVYGGGILNGSSLSIYGCTISNNTASANGGGISNTNGEESGDTKTVNAVLVVTDSASGTATTVTGNSAVYGAGIGDWGESMQLLQATSITDNGTSGTTLNGGGVFVFDTSTATFASTVSITGNTPNDVYYAETGTTATLIATRLLSELLQTDTAAVLPTSTTQTAAAQAAAFVDAVFTDAASSVGDAATDTDSAPTVDPDALDSLLIVVDTELSSDGEDTSDDDNGNSDEDGKNSGFKKEHFPFFDERSRHCFNSKHNRINVKKGKLHKLHSDKIDITRVLDNYRLATNEIFHFIGSFDKINKR